MLKNKNYFRRKIEIKFSITRNSQKDEENPSTAPEKLRKKTLKNRIRRAPKKQQPAQDKEKGL